MNNVVNLRETQRTSKLNIDCVGGVVLEIYLDHKFQ